MPFEPFVLINVEDDDDGDDNDDDGDDNDDDGDDDEDATGKLKILLNHKNMKKIKITKKIF